MDPVTAAIAGAITAWAMSGLAETTKTAISDGYTMLKDLLAQKFGAKSGVVQAIEHLEAKPQTSVLEESLHEEIIAARAEKDEEIIAAAQRILELLAQRSGSSNTLHNNVLVQGQNIGQNQWVTQHFYPLNRGIARTNERVDFFISYAHNDQQWAEWIAWCLEQAGYRILIQTWDFRPGSNFVYEMDKALARAERLIAVLSPAYLSSSYAFAEWTEAFRYDPSGERRRLIPVRIAPCEIAGILGSIVYIDLVGLDEASARKRLLEGVDRQRAKPSSVPYPATSTTQESMQERLTFPGTLPSLWNIPYQRNPFFTDREQLLERLAQVLQTGQPVTLTGLAGIGKTQLAVEYAYRHHHDYNAVFWVEARDRTRLLISIDEITELLALSQEAEQNQASTMQGVLHWLRTHDQWLLILDEVDDLDAVKELLPLAASSKHILLTTRSRLIGEQLQMIVVDGLDTESGAQLLLRQAGLITPDTPIGPATTEFRTARQLAQEMDGLPLALTIAGESIKHGGYTLQDFQKGFHEIHSFLPGGPAFDNVIETMIRSIFSQVEGENPAAIELLQLCAFLHPDDIPEEIFVDEINALDNAIRILLSYSLLSRNDIDKTLSIHRLVQTVLRDSLEEASARQWAERTVKLVNKAFPGAEFEEWYLCERYLPHALICARLVEQYHLMFPEAARLLDQTGRYLNERARYGEAEELYRHALTIREQCAGPEHPDTAVVLNNLATLCFDQGRLQEAEELYRHVMEIDEQNFGRDHPEVVTDLNNLVALYRLQGRDEEARQFAYRVLFICELHLGPFHPDTASCLSNIASLFVDQERHEEAERLYRRALAIHEQQPEPVHPATAACLNDMAVLYKRQGKYQEAEDYYQRALAIYEQCLGPLHPHTATCLNNLATLYDKQGKLDDARPLMKRAIAIYEDMLGPRHPATIQAHQNYTTLLQKAG